MRAAPGFELRLTNFFTVHPDDTNTKEKQVTNYILLYSGGGLPESPAEQAKVLKEWEAWFSKIGSGVVDQGDPFTGKAKSIGTDGKVSDGPIGSPVSGYSIIKADSLDAATALARACPVLKAGGKISVYETMKM